MTREVRPYGSWPSPITPERLVEGASVPGEARVDGDDIWWAESRPAEGGRTELVRRRVDGTTSDLLAARAAPDGRTWNARTGLLEYGGGAWCVESGVVTFAQWDDQCLYRVVADDPDAVPEPLTSSPHTERGLRYGDVVALDHGWVLAVREAHPGEEPAADAVEPVHQIVAVPTDGAAAADPASVRVLVSGPDFVSSPRPGPGRLAWTQWTHPRMPWDGTELCVAPLGRDDTGAPVLSGPPTMVAGGAEESVVQPEWDRGGALWCCSDRSGWWNLHRIADPGGAGPDAEAQVVAPVEAEVGGPQWVGGLRWYAPLGDGRILASVTSGGTTSLAVIEPGDPSAPPAQVALELGGSPVTVVSQVVAGPGPAQGVVVAASAHLAPTPVLLDLPPAAATPASDGGRGRRTVPRAASSAPPPANPVASGLPSPTSDDGPPASTTDAAPPAPIGGLDVAPTAGARTLRPARDVGLTADDIAAAQPFSFLSAGRRTAHALLYRPTSATSMAPDGDLPPLVVMIHGGPTSAARPMLDLSRQLWTTRGYAVVDVDYGGSTGYGRPYRRLLDGRWGVVDVEDCIAAARHLAAEGVVDAERMVIRGGSAGGLTTLAALCRSDVFAAGTSLYGVTDLAALAAETHKFESRYLDGLVGPWPEAAATYAERSPLNLLDGLSTPVLVLQGDEDRVVLPNQAEAVVAAAAARGVDHQYVLFEGEGHGFRRADTIVTALRTELAFYARVLDLPPIDGSEGETLLG